MIPGVGGRRLSPALEFRRGVEAAYPDVLTPDVLAALEALASLDDLRREAMTERAVRRRERARHGLPITFPSRADLIPGTSLRVEDAREGRFQGGDIPDDLRRQWV